MLLRKMLCLLLVLCPCLIVSQTFAAKPEPPRNTLVASQVFENIIDNAWTNLEFPDDIQPPGLYYIELTEPIVTPGCWGSKKDPYPDGENGELLTAWKDDEPWEDGNADFRLQYRLGRAGAWVELIAIPPQAVIIDTWWPFGLVEAQESIGQTFLALEEFGGVGLSTPTWNTANSGCTMTLYSASGEEYSVKAEGKLAMQWGKLRANN
jgi:hypothetical protein